jgi:hypothetical protein
MVPNFLSAAWCWEAFHGLRVQNVKSLILVDVIFLLDGRWRREGKKEKKNQSHREGEFPQGWTHLAGCVVGRSC